MELNFIAFFDYSVLTIKLPGYKLLYRNTLVSELSVCMPTL